MWFQVKSFISFLAQSKNQHGIHSPFVYQLITKCFYDKKKRPAYKIWKSIKEEYINSNDSLEMKDVGAGSRVFKTRKRRISEIAKNAGTTYSRAKLLNRLVPYLAIKNALELGTSLGLGSFAMALDNTIEIDSLEACPNTSKLAQQTAKKFGITHINFHQTIFSDYLHQLSNDKKFDLIFIDGHHQKEATLSYFRQLLNHHHNDSVFIFDDIYWSKEMNEAWQEIKKHPAVSLTIDTFFWGMVFFRKEQAKQDFKIRVF
ncbi:MAG: O-methyltransferase [Bacteroidota bacterium]